MTRRSILEYAEALRGRYLGASKEEKGKMLDEFTKVTGLHRKAAIRLLHRPGRAGVSKRLGRPCRYGTGVAEALRAVWEASDRLCSRRLQPCLPEMVRVLRQHGEQKIDASTQTQLCRMSPSTIDRLLRNYRKVGGRRGLTTTRPVLLPIGKGPDGYRPLKQTSRPGSGKSPSASQPAAGSQQPVDGGRTHPTEMSFRRGINPLLTMLPEYLDHLRNKRL